MSVSTVKVSVTKGIPEIKSFPPDACRVLDFYYEKAKRVDLQLVESSVEDDYKMEAKEYFPAMYNKEEVAVITHYGLEPTDEDVAVEVDKNIDLVVDHPNIEWKRGYIFNEKTGLLTGSFSKILPILDEVLPKQYEYWSSYYNRSFFGNIRSLFLGVNNDAIIKQAIQKEKLTWSRQLTDALNYLHSMKIIHRNVNPKCCVLDENRRMKLADFGSPWEEKSSTLPFYRFGSAVYSPLEVIEHNLYSLASDVYSYTMTLLYIVTNCPPFNPDDWKLKTLYQVCDTIREINRERLIMRSLSDDPSNRPIMEEIWSEVKNLDVVDLVNRMIKKDE